MSLTPENMEFREGILSHTIFRDIARMDQSQLDKYVRMAFTGQRDDEFLPDCFWDYWFDANIHGGPGDGRTAPSPAYFLSTTHNIIAGTRAGTYIIGDETEKKPNFEFRSIYRAVIQGILDECAALPGEPTEEQIRLASYAVEAVGQLESPETFNRKYYDQVVARREKENPLPESYPTEIYRDLLTQERDQRQMINKAQQLMASGKFGVLQLHYRGY